MGNEPEHGAAAELLGDWRAAGRDTVAAKAAAEVASLALEVAKGAEEAAAEAEVAANAAAEAVHLQAATSAKRAAASASEAAHHILSTATGDKVRANHAIGEAEEAEEEAGERFHEAQRHGFARHQADPRQE
jgi:hypothetical protein